MGNGLGIVAAKEADFMIHSLLKFELFGQDLYLTTTHVSILLICLGLIILALIARVKLQDTDGNAGKVSKCSGIRCGDAGWHGEKWHGQKRDSLPKLYRDLVFVYFVQ